MWYEKIGFYFKAVSSSPVENVLNKFMFEFQSGQFSWFNELPKKPDPKPTVT